MGHVRIAGRRPLPKARLAALAAAFALVALLVAAPGASAKRGLETGLIEDYDNPSAGTFDRTVQSGAGIIRIVVAWTDIAATKPANATNPADPAYNFSKLDTAVREANAHGLDVMFTVLSAPEWAE